MPLSDEQKKINKAIANKKYRQKNPEKIAVINKLYNESHKEQIKIKRDIWLVDNRPRANELARISQAKRRETAEGKKQYTLQNWKRLKLKGNYDKIYEYYLKITHCQECECEFGVHGDGSGRFKCMDHHHPTGLFRNVLCNTCNVRRR